MRRRAWNSCANLALTPGDELEDFQALVKSELENPREKPEQAGFLGEAVTPRLSILRRQARAAEAGED
jgi:hypothetical protein